MCVLGEFLLLNINNYFFLDFVVEYFGKKVVFIIGWMYWFCWVLIVMVDLIVIGMYVCYWVFGVF